MWCRGVLFVSVWVWPYRFPPPTSKGLEARLLVKTEPTYTIDDVCMYKVKVYNSGHCYPFPNLICLATIVVRKVPSS